MGQDSRDTGNTHDDDDDYTDGTKNGNVINVRVLEKCGNVAQDGPIQRLEKEVFNIHFRKSL